MNAPIVLDAEPSSRIMPPIHQVAAIPENKKRTREEFEAGHAHNKEVNTSTASGGQRQYKKLKANEDAA